MLYVVSKFVRKIAKSNYWLRHICVPDMPPVCLSVCPSEWNHCAPINPLTPNDSYRGRTAPLTSKRCILYIYSTNIGAEYFKHGIYSLFLSLQNAICFIILTYFLPVLFTFYIQSVLKFKKNNNNSGAQRLKGYLTVFRESVEKMQVLFEYNKNSGYFTIIPVYICVPGTSVDIATELCAGRFGIESRCRREFPPVQTGPGAHPTSCTMDTGSFPGVECGRGVLLTTHSLLVPRSWNSRAIPLLTLWATLSL